MWYTKKYSIKIGYYVSDCYDLTVEHEQHVHSNIQNFKVKMKLTGPNFSSLLILLDVIKDPYP